MTKPTKKIKNPSVKKRNKIRRNRFSTKKMTTKEEESKSGESSSARFTRLRDELLHEASQIVAENPGHKIAILIPDPPSSSDSKSGGGGGISAYSFGPLSADCLVKKYLEDHCSVSESVEKEKEEEKDPTSYWWEDDKILESNDPEELKAVMDEMMKFENSLAEMMEDYERDVKNQEDQSVTNKP